MKATQTPIKIVKIDVLVTLDKFGTVVNYRNVERGDTISLFFTTKDSAARKIEKYALTCVSVEEMDITRAESVGTRGFSVGYTAQEASRLEDRYSIYIEYKVLGQHTLKNQSGREFHLGANSGYSYAVTHFNNLKVWDGMGISDDSDYIWKQIETAYENQF